MSNIKELIQHIAKGVVPVQVIVCKVKSVDKDKCTIKAQPVNENADMLGVRLRAVITDNKSGLIVYPEKDSFVLVHIIDNDINQAFVALVEKVESVKLTIGTNEMTLDKDTAKVKWKQTEFNGGDNDGLVIVGKNVERLNNIERDINIIKNVFSTWTPVSMDGGAALKAASANWYAQPLIETQQADIENTKITH